MSPIEDAIGRLSINTRFYDAQHMRVTNFTPVLQQMSSLLLLNIYF